MIKNISHLTLLVKDQETALNFYKKIGFVVHTDVEFPGSGRWLTIATPHNQHLEIALIKADEEELPFVGKQTGGKKPLFSVETDDCLADYHALKAQGVQFATQPVVEDWGIGVIFYDCEGNMIYLCQSPESK